VSSDDIHGLETRVAGLETSVKRVRAVMFGSEADELGGILADIQRVKTGVKVMNWIGGLMLAVLSPEAIRTLMAIVKELGKP